ncbi:methionine adenosyltransferase [Haloplanus sp.]|uniref:methionine adenosyltransferase n=1 Tax=Haloplanus sp. TaxID=1961696 RepID=UPI002631ACB6|nr:methionine adenosyltransferase [Haloplanus sp.]
MSDRNIRIESVGRRAVEDQEVEIVERKGIGHPDSLCDGIAEHVSRALSNLYLDRVGRVLHYNTDETQLAAGNAAPDFGGGEIIEPIYVLVVGRATRTYEADDGTEHTLPVDSVALSAARDYLAEVVPELDFGTDVVVDTRLGEGSGDLQTVFGEENATVPMANDTSFGVGHAPLTETERIVLDAEEQLNGPYAADNPELGPDVKIMGKREGNHIDLTVAAAMIDRHLDGVEAYLDAVADVRESVTDLARDRTDRTVAVEVNTADDPEKGTAGIYLTTTGTSAEQGDDGSVGRGNRANGLITPNRPMSMEATSGKNPVNHIGKIYNLLSTQVAEAVVDEVSGIRDFRVRLLSQIGRPIDRPHVADAFVVTEDGVTLSDIETDIEAIVDNELADVTSITRQVVNGDLRTF